MNSVKVRLHAIYKTLFDALGPQHWWPGRTRFEIIVGAILTQNTAWTNVEKAIARLRKARLLTPEAMTRIPISQLASHIISSGYYNQKAIKLKNFLYYLNCRRNGKLGDLKNIDAETARKDLLEIKGIGPETADSILLYALGKPSFVIDAYTKRIFSRHGFCPEDVEYHALQELFMENLPRDRAIYNEYHALLVMIGKNFCKKRNPACSECPLQKDLAAG